MPADRGNGIGDIDVRKMRPTVEGSVADTCHGIGDHRMPTAVDQFVCPCSDNGIAVIAAVKNRIIFGYMDQLQPRTSVKDIESDMAHTFRDIDTFQFGI